jgi:hypothetical protein
MPARLAMVPSDFAPARWISRVRGRHVGGGEICVGLDAIHGGIAAAPSNAKHPGQRSLRTLDAFNLLPGALTRAWL